MDIEKVIEILLSVLLGSGVVIWAFDKFHDKRQHHRKADILFDRARREYNRAVTTDQRRVAIELPGSISRNRDPYESFFSEDTSELRIRSQELLDRALEASPSRRTKTRIYVLQAEMLIEEKSFQETVRYCSEALKVNRKLSKAYELRAEANEALNKKRQALNDYRKIANHDPYDDNALSHIKYLEENLGIEHTDELSVWQKVLEKLGVRDLCMTTISV